MKALLGILIAVMIGLGIGTLIKQKSDRIDQLSIDLSASQRDLSVMRAILEKGYAEHARVKQEEETAARLFRDGLQASQLPSDDFRQPINPFK